MAQTNESPVLWDGKMGIAYKAEIVKRGSKADVLANS